MARVGSLLQLRRSAAACRSRLGDMSPTAAFVAGSRVSSSGPSALQRRFLQSQAGLLTLPVPELQATLDKYARTLIPIASEEELLEEAKLIRDFKESGAGDELQQMLVRHAAGKDNWLTDWWERTAYLGYRGSVLIDVNPGISLPAVRFSSQREWLTHCSRMVLSFLEYRRRLLDRSLEPDLLRGKELDMSQYWRVFNCCRIPRPGMDEFRLFADEKQSEELVEDLESISVAYRGSFYRVRVLRDGRSLPLSVIRSQLQLIVSQPAGDACAGVGILSAADRDFWADRYCRLVQAHPDNERSLGSVQRSLLLLCLDSAVGASSSEAAACENSLHGLKVNSDNRLFDKTLQLTVSEDGACGCNYEHTSAEAVVFLKIFDFVLQHMQDHPAADVSDDASAETEAASLMRRLPLAPYQELQADLATVRADVHKRIDNLQLVWSRFEAFGKEFAKSQGVSPDAMMQVALQLAYWRLHRRHCATYESGSLRRFRRGRTDTIRSCTPEAADFCRLMLPPSPSPSPSPSPDASAAAVAFRSACAAHSAYTADVVNGRGVDRHLLALRLVAEAAGRRPHPLLQSPLLRRAMAFGLSTSQVPADSASTVCYGPAVSDGYGVCYNQRRQEFLLAVTAFRDGDGTDAGELAESLRRSLLDIQQALQEAAPPKAKL